MKYEPVWSIWPCSDCKTIDRGDEGVMNPISCPYTHVRIGRKIYQRSNLHGEDDEDIFIHTEDGARHMEEDFVRPWDEIRCHDCGVPHGYIHHIGCDCEVCPKCGDQFISCDCGVKGDHKEAEFLIAIPELNPEELR